MNIQNKFLQLAGEPDLTTVLKSVINKVGLELNCVRVGIIQSFNDEDLTAQVLITNKRTLGINQDGTQATRDYAVITAKICYCCPFITYPIEPGEECVLLFNDRELESWFLTGEVQPEAYQRMHDLTDCIAIVGLRSLARMITIAADTLHLFYGNNSIKLSDTNGTQITNLKAMNGASQNIDTQFTSYDGKTITVNSGIITKIE